MLTHADSLVMFFGKEPMKMPQIPDSAKLSPISFGVTFIPRTKDIKYTPTNIQQQRLDDYHKAIFTLGAANAIKTSDNPIEDIRYNYTIDHPDKVEHTWREVPEIWNIVKQKRNRKDKYEEQREIADLVSIKHDYGKTELRLPKEEKSPWTVTGQENLQLSQLLLANWAKGGESSMSLISDFRYIAKYTNNRHEWENNIVHKLGVTRTSTLGARVSDDELNLSSKYGYKAVSKWFYSFKNTFKTQMFRNYKNSDKNKEKPKSTLLSPAYIQFIFGMDYKNKDLSLLLSPFTAIITVVADTSTIDQTAYSIPKNKKSSTVDGFSITVNWKKKFNSSITYSTKCELFYEYFEKHGQKRFDWENVADLQINRFLTTRILFELRYFDNESSKFQVKENISVAFKYTF
ncbi:MAG: DUF3078 domain-containing protein [Bacteroidales bacterium]|nr:DUF3078 domain-containing protein [Bacteroidales bacterium]